MSPGVSTYHHDWAPSPADVRRDAKPVVTHYHACCQRSRENDARCSVGVSARSVWLADYGFGWCSSGQLYRLTCEPRTEKKPESDEPVFWEPAQQVAKMPMIIPPFFDKRRLIRQLNSNHAHGCYVFRLWGSISQSIFELCGHCYTALFA